MTRRTPFDAICSAAVVHELQPLIGARLQRIAQTDDHTLLLGLYRSQNSAENDLAGENPLAIIWHPEFARMHLLAKRPPSPKNPTPFAMALRKFVGEGRIAFVRQRGLDRIVDIGISAPEGDFQLVVELMGRHSNVALVDSDRKILACAKHVSPKQSKRPIRPGIAYEPPPFDPKPTLLDVKPGDDLKGIEGVSPFLRDLIGDKLTLEQVQNALKSGKFDPHFSHTAGAYPFEFAVDSIPRVSMSIALEQAFALREQSDALTAKRTTLAAQIQRVIDARNTALQGIAEAIQLADRSHEIQQQAELILAYQGQIKLGDTKLDAYDYEGNPIEIPLLADKTAVENANRLFNRAKHAKERRSEVEHQQHRLQRDLNEALAFFAQIEAATTPDELDHLKDFALKHKWLHTLGAPKAKEDRPFQGFPIRELLSPGGYRVLYGTNATSNDHLTTKIAKGNDWWFHVRGQTSSHVILLTQGQPEKVQMPDLMFAALVSVKNSVAKHASHVPVDYTLKKYVRKPRGSAPGLAVYEREKTLHVDP